VNAPAAVAVPPGVVRDTTAGPTGPAGVTADTKLCEEDTDVAATPPIVTALVPERFVPEIVMVVPPAIGPAMGLTPEIVGITK
jgi:hypothetical protein